MTTVGAVFLPQLPPERLRYVAQAADAAGLDQLWLWEDCFRESGIAAAAAALAWTERLSVGVGLLPVPLRTVALTAMELATLHRMFGPRPVIGVGHGVQDWMGQAGARVGSPLTLLREQLDALRSLLSGTTVTTAGRYVQLDGVGLDWPPPFVPPLYAGGEGPKTLRLTGAHADGTILVGGTSPDELRAARALVEEGRAEAGRGGHHLITVYLPAATGTGAQDRMDANAAKWGWPSVEDRTAVGDAATVAAAVGRLAAAGADTVVLQPTDDDPDPEGFVTFAAEVGRLTNA
ncbi:MAG TPA: LLM class flavin-dependent oxidoreductase [Mycobacteriales bacterium]|nr:LLM class flavin-dependent oxidoreductase [Mycobacteriales bacterium]